MKKDDRREAARKVTQAIGLLPPDKRGYILGYSQGVIDATARQKERKEDDSCKP